jgi:hypothetical protein
MDDLAEIPDHSWMDRRALLSRMRRKKQTRQSVTADFDFESWTAALAQFDAGCTEHNASLASASLALLSKHLQNLESLPWDCFGSLGPGFFNKLFESFDSQNASLISNGILFMCFIVYLDRELAQLLFDQHRFSQLFDFLRAGNEPEHLFFLFSNALDTDSVLHAHEIELADLIREVLTGTSDFGIRFSAMCCCYSLSCYSKHLDFMADLIPTFKMMITATGGENDPESQKLV